MNNLEIESILDGTINKAVEQGIVIGNKWGVRNFASDIIIDEAGKQYPNPKNEWRCLGNSCCPLSTLVLFSDLDQPDKNIKYNVVWYITEILGVSIDWVRSFCIGFDAMRVGYFSDFAAYELGQKFRMKYIGIEICQ